MLKDKIAVIADELYFPKDNPDFFSGFLHLLMLQLTKEDDDVAAELIFLTVNQLLTAIDEEETAPKVVLDRTMFYDETVEKMHRILLSNDVTYLNHPDLMRLFASKLESFNLLKREGILQPVTQKLMSYQEFEEFIRQHKKIVVKPEWGSGGDLVFFVSLDDKNQVTVNWTAKGDNCCNEESFVGSMEDFYKNLDELSRQQKDQESRSSDEKTEWIMQDFLDLKSGRERAVDIRIIKQRGKDGVLKPVLTHGRMAASEHSLVTNLSKHGIPISVENVLEGTGITEDDLFEFCRQVDNCVESEFGHQIGEVGHDLAVVKTENGWKIYYIEGNTMPGYLLDSWETLNANGANVKYLSERDKTLLMNPIHFMNSLLSIKEDELQAAL